MSHLTKRRIAQLGAWLAVGLAVALLVRGYILVSLGLSVAALTGVVVAHRQFRHDDAAASTSVNDQEVKPVVFWLSVLAFVMIAVANAIFLWLNAPP